MERLMEFCNTGNMSSYEDLPKEIQNELIRGSFQLLFQGDGRLGMARDILIKEGLLEVLLKGEELGSTEDIVCLTKKGNKLFNKTKSKWFKLVAGGVTTYPVYGIEELDQVGNDFDDSYRSFPEYNRDEDKADLDSVGNPIRYIVGGFSAEGNPASFHTPFVRNLRKRSTERLRNDILMPMSRNAMDKDLVRKLRVTTMADRSMRRPPMLTPTPEAWHRDVAADVATVSSQAVILGGWVNTSKHSQFFSTIVGSHLGVRVAALRDRGFAEPGSHLDAKIRSLGRKRKSLGESDEEEKEDIDEEIAQLRLRLRKMRKILSSKKSRIEIPPGHAVSFPQYILHEVVANPVSHWIERVFVGYNLDVLDRPIWPITERLRSQAILPLGSGQEPPMYSRSHLNYFQAKSFYIFGKDNPDHGKNSEDPILLNLSEWSTNTFKEECLRFREGKPTLVARFLPSLEELGLPMYPEYTTEEIELYLPTPLLEEEDAGQEKEEKEENMDTEDGDCDIQDLDEMKGFLWSNEDRDRESSVPDIKVIKGKEIVSYKADDYIDTELTMLNGEDAGHMQYVPNFLTDEEATCLFDHLTKGFDQETGDFIGEGEPLTYDEHEVTKKKQKAVIRIGFNQERRDHRARADSGEPKIPTRSFNVDWTMPIVRMQGRVIGWPRILSAMYDEGLLETPELSSGETWNVSEGWIKYGNAWTPVIEKLRDKLEQFTGRRLRYMQMNWYRDGQDSIGKHTDSEMLPDDLVVSISLGAERDFNIHAAPYLGKGGGQIPQPAKLKRMKELLEKYEKEREGKSKIGKKLLNQQKKVADYEEAMRLKGKEYRLKLESGSLLVFDEKTGKRHWQHEIPKSKDGKGARINLTFRTVDFVNEEETENETGDEADDETDNETDSEDGKKTEEADEKRAFECCIGKKTQKAEKSDDLVIASWNVNSLRARIVDPETAACKRGTRQILDDSPLGRLIEETNPNIICFQETKCGDKTRTCFGEEGQINDDGFYTYWNCAERSGIHGVAIWSRIPADTISVELPGLNPRSDVLLKEGRILSAGFGNLMIVTTYSPNTLRAGNQRVKGEYDSDEELDYRYPDPEIIRRRRDWDSALADLLADYKEKGFDVIWCGDFNIARGTKDIWPGDWLASLISSSEVDESELERYSEIHDNFLKDDEEGGGAGYRLEERSDFADVLSRGFVDVYRSLHNEDSDYGFTFWDMKIPTRRGENKGWRIDYFVVDESLMDENGLQVKDVHVYPEIGYTDSAGERLINPKTGNFIVASDHAPIVMTLTRSKKLKKKKEAVASTEQKEEETRPQTPPPPESPEIVESESDVEVIDSSSEDVIQNKPIIYDEWTPPANGVRVIVFSRLEDQAFINMDDLKKSLRDVARDHYSVDNAPINIETGDTNYQKLFEMGETGLLQMDPDQRKAELVMELDSILKKIGDCTDENLTNLEYAIRDSIDSQNLPLALIPVQHGLTGCFEENKVFFVGLRFKSSYDERKEDTDEEDTDEEDTDEEDTDESEYHYTDESSEDDEEFQKALEMSHHASLEKIKDATEDLEVAEQIDWTLEARKAIIEFTQQQISEGREIFDMGFPIGNLLLQKEHLQHKIASLAREIQGEERIIFEARSTIENIKSNEPNYESNVKLQQDVEYNNSLVSDASRDLETLQGELAAKKREYETLLTRRLAPLIFILRGIVDKQPNSFRRIDREMALLLSDSDSELELLKELRSWFRTAREYR